MTTPENNPHAAANGRRFADNRPTPDAPSGPGFGSAVGWTLAGTVIPGLGLWRAGHRIAAGVILGALVVGFGGLVAFAVTNPQALKSSAVDPNVLYGAAAALIAIALIWAAVITASHLALRPHPATPAQRVGGGILVGVLSFVVATPLGLAANVAYTTADGISTIFGDDPSDGPSVNVEDPWKGVDKLNILILGGDSGTGRDIKLGIRPDSVSVASLDTRTGAVTLVNIPRQTAKMPFPADSPLHKYYPHGFYDGVNPLNQEYALNAMYRNIPARVPKDILGKTKNLGADIMKVSVGEALGLKIDYYVMVNMDGFKDIINAIGGITVNVNDRVPIGGHNASGPKPEQKPAGWIEIGANQHLNGRLALWYARGRYHTTDYKRMERQQCVVNAVLKQSDPMKILNNYQSIVAAGTKTIFTDVPRTLLAPIAELALKAKSHSIHNVLLNHQNGFDTTAPNWPAVQAKVRKAIAAGAAEANSSASPAPVSSESPGSSASPKPKKDSLDYACAYHPNN